MKTIRNKLFSIILLAILLVCLTACGSNSPRGTYETFDGAWVLALGEDKMYLRDRYGIQVGEYRIVGGDELHFTYTFVDSDVTEQEFGIYSYQNTGDTITLDGEKFYRTNTKQGSGLNETLPYIGIAAGIIAISLVVFVFLKKKTKSDGKSAKRKAHRTKAEVSAPVKNTAASPKQKRGESVSAAAGNARQPAGNDDQRGKGRIPLTQDICCICGQPLTGEAVPLGNLPAGKQAWIDRSCLIKLQTLGKPDSEESFERASRYLKGQTRYVDPDIATALRRFIQKAEDRFYFNS